MFITSANLLGPIPAALRDRMELVRLPGYSEEEKLGIARQFLIPHQLQEHGLLRAELEFADSAVRGIIGQYAYEAGMPNLEREIGVYLPKVDPQDGRRQAGPAPRSTPLATPIPGPTMIYQLAAPGR
ncbi:MAG: hypothetical protein H8E35_01750 [Ardenticatenia bacterium]|nr:hypothetical protein [Ardenticatenia bacterium]